VRYFYLLTYHYTHRTKSIIMSERGKHKSSVCARTGLARPGSVGPGKPGQCVNKARHRRHGSEGSARRGHASPRRQRSAGAAGLGVRFAPQARQGRLDPSGRGAAGSAHHGVDGCACRGTAGRRWQGSGSHRVGRHAGAWLRGHGGEGLGGMARHGTAWCHVPPHGVPPHGSAGAARHDPGTHGITWRRGRGKEGSPRHGDAGPRAAGNARRPSSWYRPSWLGGRGRASRAQTEHGEDRPGRGTDGRGNASAPCRQRD
jgi:hypothetical protein